MECAAHMAAGNIRELENCIERGVMSDRDILM
jgi:transcriptional regulator with GAF, ATPase, and Fis domain